MKTLIRLLLSLLFLSLPQNASAAITSGDPPSISSFYPHSAFVGDSVTIVGTHFNPTQDSNIVYFGGVRAIVSSATDTSLRVIVPSGSTYGPITVTNLTNNLTAYSGQAFTARYPGNGIIDSSSFALSNDLLTGYSPGNIVLYDIDQNGSPDVLFVNFNSSSFSAYLNSSTQGSPAFGSSGEFRVSMYAQHIACGDLNGDGLQDIVIANYDNAVSLFQNVGSQNSMQLQFLGNSLLVAPARTISVRDFDLDGKPDLAVTYEDSPIVTILANQSSPDSCIVSKDLDLTAVDASRCVVSADIDNDGKPDLIVTNPAFNTISIYRNNSSIGNISFEARIVVLFAIYNATDPIKTADIDGDGKIDILGLLDGNTLSVLRNLSTPGDIQFAPRKDFVTGAYPQGVAVGDITGDGRPDVAVGNYTDKSVSIFKNLSSPDTIAFASKVDFSTSSEANCVAIGDLDHDGKPDLIVNTVDSHCRVLHNNIPLSPDTSVAIQLSSFTGSSNGVDVTLNWETLTEMNNSGFEVQRFSPETDSWSVMAFILGAGSSSSPKTYQFIDRHLISGRHIYRLKQVDVDGAFTFSHSAEIEVLPPKDFELHQNYPNPFNPSTTFRIALPQVGQASLKVFNTLGMEVATVYQGVLSAGHYQFGWSAGQLPSGVYFYRLQSGSYTATKKLILMK